jgi:hypothetical protein
VLSPSDGVLFFFKSKEQREQKHSPHIIPFEIFIGIQYVDRDKEGLRLNLRVTSGRVYELLGKFGICTYTKY